MSRKLSIVAIALVTTALVAGCTPGTATTAPSAAPTTAASGGASVAPASQPAASGNTQGITDGKLLVALSSPESGAGSFAAAYAAGLKAYMEYANAQGGVAGFTFEPLIVDNAGTAAGGAPAMQQILQRDPFFTVITGSSSFGSSVDIIKAGDAELPVLGFGNAAIIGGSGLQNSYGFFPNYTRECFFQAEFLLGELQAKRIALVYEDSAIGQGPAADCPQYATAKGATEVTSIAVPPPTVSTNYSSIAAQLRDFNADGVMFFGSNTELVGIQKAAFAIGATPPWIGLATSFDAAYFELVGEAGEGTYFDAFAEPTTTDSPEANLFRTEMQTRAPNAVNTFGGYGWSFGNILQKAITDATASGGLSRETLVAALDGLKTEKIGLLYSADYTAVPDQSTLTNSLQIYQAKGGQFVLTRDLTPDPPGALTRRPTTRLPLP